MSLHIYSTGTLIVINNQPEFFSLISYNKTNRHACSKQGKSSEGMSDFLQCAILGEGTLAIEATRARFLIIDGRFPATVFPSDNPTI